MISTAPERRRRRPAIRCNRESPCSNCVKSKSEPCVYDNNDALRPQRHLGFRHTLELDIAKASQASQTPLGLQVQPQAIHQDMLPPIANASREPSTVSRSVPSSSKGSWSRTTQSAVSEVESLKSKIQRLEEQLSKVVQEPMSSPAPDVRPDLETATSGIAGTFHINRENRIDDERHAISRNVVMHKSRLFGPSHWAQGASMFREVFEMIEPYLRNGDSKAVANLKRCKELARVIKAQRTPQWPTPPTSNLPPKGVADELVDCYLRTIETTFRILHIPTFRTDYDALWVTDAKPSTAFAVQLKLVLALGAVTYDDYFSMRPSAVRWVYEAQTWLSDPDFKPQLNIQCLQSRVLLIIARECINVGGDATWISAGALLRTALYMGLHRDPAHLPNRTTLAAEMRRRLWNTIIELSLQASIVSGGAPLVSLSDFDCEPPGNFDDEQLLTEDPVPKSDKEYTQTSIARALRQTYSHRLSIAKSLNDLNSHMSYQGTLRLDAELRATYRAILRTLRGYSLTTGPSPSSFETRVLDFIVNYYLCCAHLPFFELSLQEASYAFSRKVVVESALKLWCDAYPSSPLVTSLPSRDEPVSNQDTLTRMVTCGFGFFRLGSMISTMYIALELKAQLQDEDSLGPNPYRRDLFSLISEAKARTWTMIECGETNIKGYLLASMIIAQIEGLWQGVEKSKLPDLLLQAAEEAEGRCLAFLEEKAGQGASGPDINMNMTDDLGLNRTPTFMGDWEFIYSQTLQNITDAKLEELSKKRNIFLKRKASALEAAQALDSPTDKVRALSDGVKACFNINVRNGRVVHNSSDQPKLEVAISNLDHFLKQAEYDPAISPVTVERWRQSLLSHLDIQTLKYEYATLFAQLTMEWLSVKKNRSPDVLATSKDDFEKLASTTKLESRKEWEDFVFTPAGYDADTVKRFLNDLFSGVGQSEPVEEADKDRKVNKALRALRNKVAAFETSLSRETFNTSTLNWIINGLLHSDLVTDKQRAVLQEFKNDNTVLTELSDVLNMRLAGLHGWSWGPAVSVEQRRQLNGSYQIYMHEDLIQAIFLQYIGVKWSVFFKGALHDFRRTRYHWKSLRSTVPAIDKKRRNFFIEGHKDKPNLQMVKEAIHRQAYFVSQLLDNEYQIRKQEEGEEEADTSSHAKRGRTKQTARKSSTIMNLEMCMEEAVDGSDEDMGFGLFDGEDADYDPDLSYNAHWAESVKTPANQMQAKQNLLLLLSADTIINKRLHGEITCFRAQYDSLYPSLPHPTILAVLEFLGVSETWLTFFEKFLTAPLRFIDEPDTGPRTRRRGTPGSHVLSEVFGETTLFCLDVMINLECNGEILWRVNDDLWFWSREQQACVTAWQAIQQFNKTMGISVSVEKSGGAHITAQSDRKSTMDSSLPSGKIRWGMLYLNPESGCFEIDQEMVDSHIKELRRQLDDKQGSVFSWIQAWNSYASAFFTYNFGLPANCFGQAHVDMMLQTHERIQREIFSLGPDGGKGDSSVLTYLRDTIRSRFGTDNIPDGYFFLPIDLGGLELSSPFINLVGLHDSVLENPDSLLDDFFETERSAYASLKRHYEEKDKDKLASQHNFRPDDADSFMSFEEYTRHREFLFYGFGKQLVSVYDQLLRRPQPEDIKQDISGPVTLGLSQLQNQLNLSGIKWPWSQMKSYWKWLAQLYGPEIVEQFGGFNIVDPGLLPIGLVSQFRSGRVNWTEE
ncbi:hypothetical protein BJX63DRAFT_421499 [Aspergillus granulosus]|uniref:Xylanolytic transcriptional activator regulatory domain-containing protein n=1 Tax=Aspergillus granulosus TaxID=176169 RepID=A0ABR4HBX0_9EURO